MLVYGSDKYSDKWDSESIWQQSIKRATSCSPAQQPKHRKLTPSNKSFLKSLGLKVLEK